MWKTRETLRKRFLEIVRSPHSQWYVYRDIRRVQENPELYLETSNLSVKKVEICFLSGQHSRFARNLIG